MSNNRPNRTGWTIFLSIVVVLGLLGLTMVGDKSGRNFYFLSLSLLVVATIGLIFMIVRSVKARR